MGHDPLDYPLLLQEALRGIVRRSLEIVAEQGLPGDHHFYLSLRTDAPGVIMPPHLRDLHPEEMTIVLQHRFQDLEVWDEAFSVGLFFGGVLHHLTIPFDALTAFVDPEAGFRVVFEPSSPPEEEEPDAAAEPERGTTAAASESGPDNVVAFSGFRKRK